MFTGIIEEIGTVNAIKKGVHFMAINIGCGLITDDLRIGDSVSVNGVCLTAAECSKGGFTADVMHETMNRSTLGVLRIKSKVNLERAMPANGRFGGHIVTGHIDGTGLINKIENDGNATWYEINAPMPIMKYIVEKGSIAIDGISLTVAKVTGVSFSVSIIPHTAGNTNLSEKRAGDHVNLENDILGKYVEKLMESGRHQKPQNGVTKEFLIKHGY